MTAKPIGTLAIILLLVACGSGLNQPPASQVSEAMRVLYRGIQCPATQAGIQIIRDADAWSEWQSQRQKMSFSAEKDTANAAPDLNFGQISVIVISMGQRTTAGYSVDVADGSVTLNGTTLTVNTVWQEPLAGAILPQVVTSPCVAITDSNTQYDSIKITNQNGDIVIEQSI